MAGKTLDIRDAAGWAGSAPLCTGEQVLLSELFPLGLILAATVHPALGPCFTLIFLSVCAPAKEALARSRPPPSAGRVIGMTMIGPDNIEGMGIHVSGALKASFYLRSRHSLSILLQLAVHPPVSLVGDEQHDDVALVEAEQRAVVAGGVGEDGAHAQPLDDVVEARGDRHGSGEAVVVTVCDVCERVEEGKAKKDDNYWNGWVSVTALYPD